MFWAAIQKALCHGLLLQLFKPSDNYSLFSKHNAKFWWEALGDWKLEDFSEIIQYCNWRRQNKTGRFWRTASLFIGETRPHAWPWLSSLVTLKITALESWQGTARIVALRQQRIQKKQCKGEKSWTLTPLESNYFPLNSTWYQKWLNTNPGQVAQRALSSLLCWRGWSECSCWSTRSSSPFSWFMQPSFKRVAFILLPTLHILKRRWRQCQKNNRV